MDFVKESQRRQWFWFCQGLERCVCSLHDIILLLFSCFNSNYLDASWHILWYSDQARRQLSKDVTLSYRDFSGSFFYYFVFSTVAIPLIYGLIKNFLECNHLAFEHVLHISTEFSMASFRHWIYQVSKILPFDILFCHFIFQIFTDCASERLQVSFYIWCRESFFLPCTKVGSTHKTILTDP